MIAARWPAWVGLGVAGAALVGGLIAGLAMGGDGDGGGPGWGRKRKARAETSVPRQVYAEETYGPGGVDVALPRAADGTNLGRPSIRVTISADQLWLDGEELEDDELVARLGAAAVRDPETQVVFATGADVPYQRVIRFMDLAQQAGLKRVALSSDDTP